MIVRVYDSSKSDFNSVFMLLLLQGFDGIQTTAAAYK